MRPTSLAIASSLACLLAADTGAQVSLDVLGTYASGVFDEGAAEISAYDPGSMRLFVTNADANTLDVLDLSDPADPTKLFEVDLSPAGGGVNSVAVHAGLVAVALEAEVKQDPGLVVFLDVDGRPRGAAQVGALPDMLTFTPDGRYLLVANEGEPDDDYLVDPEGSISIIDLQHGVAGLTVATAGFEAFDAADLDPAVRIFGPGASVAQDLEPEFIAVSPNGRVAWVSCQENNALAIVDVAAARVVDIVALGFKDHGAAGNALDPSNEDGGIAVANWPVFGMYQPDAIAVVEHDGLPYVLSANEGDARDYDGFSEEARIKDLVLDPGFAPQLQDDDQLGRLTTTTVGGDTDGDGDKDVLFAFGARSMSVWGPQGDLVWDSGDLLEQVTAAALPDHFNSTNDENGTFDNRSDDKGPEPEGITVGIIGDATYAFLGLERVGGIVVFDVTDPTAPVFVEYVNNRDFAGDAEAGTAGDLGPEGLVFIPAAEGPDGRDLLVVSNEVSGTTTIYHVASR